jgi:hypothetical protein
MAEWQLFALILLWIVILVEAALLFLLYRHVGLIYGNRSASLPVGSNAPELVAHDRQRNLLIEF